MLSAKLPALRGTTDEPFVHDFQIVFHLSSLERDMVGRILVPNERSGPGAVGKVFRREGIIDSALERWTFLSQQQQVVHCNHRLRRAVCSDMYASASRQR